MDVQYSTEFLRSQPGARQAWSRAQVAEVLQRLNSLGELGNVAEQPQVPRTTRQLWQERPVVVATSRPASADEPEAEGITRAAQLRGESS